MVGERLRQARLAAGLSLQGLADKLERPITRRVVAVRNGRFATVATRISELARALNVQASSLLTESAVEIRWKAFESSGS